MDPGYAPEDTPYRYPTQMVCRATAARVSTEHTDSGRRRSESIPDLARHGEKQNAPPTMTRLLQPAKQHLREPIAKGWQLCGIAMKSGVRRSLLRLAHQEQNNRRTIVGLTKRSITDH